MKKDNVGPVLDAILTRVKKTTNDKVEVCREFIKEKINEQQAKAACIVTLTPEAADIVSDYSKSLELPKDSAASMIIKLYSQDKQKAIKEEKSSNKNTFTIDQNTMPSLAEIANAYNLTLEDTLHRIIVQQAQALKVHSDRPDFEDSVEMNKIFKSPETSTTKPIVEDMNHSDELGNVDGYVNPSEVLPTPTNFTGTSEIDGELDLIQTIKDLCLSETPDGYSTIEPNADDFNPGDTATLSHAVFSKKELVPMIIKCIKEEMSLEEIQELLKVDTEYFNSLMLEIGQLSDYEIAHYGEINDSEDVSKTNTPEVLDTENTLSDTDKLKAEILIAARQEEPLAKTLERLNLTDAEFTRLLDELSLMSASEQNRLLEDYTN